MWYEVNMFMMKYDTCMIWKCSLLYFGASESDIQIKLLTVWICATLQNMIQESDVRISGGFRGTNRVQSASISYMEDIQIKYSCPETGLPATCIRFCNVAQNHTVTIIGISKLCDMGITLYSGGYPESGFLTPDSVQPALMMPLKWSVSTPSSQYSIRVNTMLQNETTN